MRCDIEDVVVAVVSRKSLSGKTSALDKLRLSRAQILWGMYHQKNVDYVKLLWEDFNYQIDNKVYKNQDKIDDSTESESESWGNDEDDNNDESDAKNESNDEENESDDEETQSYNEKDDDNMETKNDEKMEGDEDKGMDDTTTQFDDDVYEGLNEPIHPTGEGALTEGVDAEMVDAQHGNENLVITQEQVTKDAHVTISTVAKETEAPIFLLNFFSIVYPQVHESFKLTMEEHVHIENPPCSSGTLSSMKNLDDAFTFEKRSANFKEKHQLQDKTTKALASRIYNLEYHDLYSKIDKQVNEVVKEAVNNALQAPLHHAALCEALEVSMQRENNNELHATLAQSRKRRRDDQDPPLPPPKNSDQSKKKRLRGYGAAYLPKDQIDQMLKRYQKIGKSKLVKADLEGLDYKLVKPFHKNSISLQFQMEECHLLLTDQINLINPEGNRVVQDISKPLPLGGPPGQVTIQTQYFFNKDLEYLVSGDKERRNALSISKLTNGFYPGLPGFEELSTSPLWTESERDYDISTTYGILHWWFKYKEFYITIHSAPSNRSAVRSHMKILSVVSLKTYSRYGYTFLKDIVLRRADYKEYKISEADFKNLHPNDFEDMYLLHLQGKLNHLSGADKEQSEEDDERNEVHKFNYGTLTRILEKLDFTVKDFELFKFNPGMEHRIWSEDDKRRSPEFIKLIERRLKIRRIFQSLESFVSGHQNQRDLPRDNPLVSVEVLRYDIKRSKSENKGIVPTEMELVLEQTKQGTSHEVSIVVMDPVMQCTTLPSHSSEDGNPARANIKQALRHSDIKNGIPDGSSCDQVLKLKNFKNKEYSSFQDQERYGHVGLDVTRSQDGEISRDGD
ncbi:hypothetical protein Tco_0612907 [Tanacetum coccineum]